MLVEFQRTVMDSREKGKVIPLPAMASVLEKLAKVSALIQPADIGPKNHAPNLAGLSDDELLRMFQGAK